MDHQGESEHADHKTTIMTDRFWLAKQPKVFFIKSQLPFIIGVPDLRMRIDCT